MSETLLAATCGKNPLVAPYMVHEGFSPAALLAPVVLSQSNVEGNQLKHETQVTWIHTDGGFSPLGPVHRDYLCLPQLRVGIHRQK